MKYKKILIFAFFFFILSPLSSKADDLKDIKDIRGDKNYYESLVIDHVGLNYDQTLIMEDDKNILIDENNLLDDLEGKQFIFSSGAGGWWTLVNFEENGNFQGEYIDGDYDLTIVNEFEGKFSIDQKVNSTCYILNLDEAKVTSPTGNKDIKHFDNGEDMPIEFVELAYGFEISQDEPFSFQDKFTLYLPTRSRDEISDPVNEWLNRNTANTMDQYILREYLLVNNSTLYPFRELPKTDKMDWWYR